MVQFHTHEIPTATKAEAEAGVRDDIALSPASLFGANLPILVPPSPGVWVSDTPPENPYDGQLWWESDTSILWTWYVDPDSSQWVQISGGTGSKSSVVIADSAPEDADNGQLWWHSGNGNLYCWYIDPSGPPGQWVQVNTSGGIVTSSGTGSPNGVVTAIVGALYTRLDGGAGSTLYVKESGSGNTGWVAK